MIKEILLHFLRGKEKRKGECGNLPEKDYYVAVGVQILQGSRWCNYHRTVARGTELLGGSTLPWESQKEKRKRLPLLFGEEGLGIETGKVHTGTRVKEASQIPQGVLYKEGR